jgi:hypothetical protein
MGEGKMTVFNFDRRMLLQTGAIAAAEMLVSNLADGAGIAAAAQKDELPAALLGWLIVDPRVGIRVRLVELNAQAQPIRAIAGPTIPSYSLSEAARAVTAAAKSHIGARWEISSSDCVCGLGGIEHCASGLSIPFMMWTDFV